MFSLLEKLRNKIKWDRWYEALFIFIVELNCLGIIFIWEGEYILKMEKWIIFLDDFIWEEENLFEENMLSVNNSEWRKVVKGEGEKGFGLRGY